MTTDQSPLIETLLQVRLFLTQVPARAFVSSFANAAHAYFKNRRGCCLTKDNEVKRVGRYARPCSQKEIVSEALRRRQC